MPYSKKKIICIETIEQLETLSNIDLNKLNIDTVYITSDTINKDNEKIFTNLNKLIENNINIGIRLSRLGTDEQSIKSFFYDIKDAQLNKKPKSNALLYNSIMVRNIDQLSFAASLLKKITNNNFKFNREECKFTICIDWSLNVYNNETRKFLISNLNNYISEECIKFTYNLEQNTNELKLLDMDELVFYGYVPVMATSNCILKSTDKCIYPDRNYDDLEPYENDNIFTSAHTYIIDRKKEKVNVKTYCKFCYNQIFNPEPIFLCDMRDELSKINYEYERYDFTFEDGQSMIKILVNEERPHKFTRGHIKRGID